jgi:beta-lactamase regulating signal transducer with metallopeptidase domain
MVTLVWWLGTNALVVAGLAPIVWLLCRLLRSRPAIEHLLWFLLFLKLIAPQVLYWPWPVEGVFAAFNTDAPGPLIHGGLDLPVVLEEEGAAGIAPEVVHSEPTVQPATLPAAVSTKSSEPAISMVAVAVVGWAVGAVLLVFVSISAIWRQQQIVRNSVDAPEHLSIAIRRVASRLGIRPPKIAVSEQIGTPIVCCAGSPRLLWPATMSDPDVVAQCDGVLAHELAHLARRDHYFVYAELIVTVCCWWNPLMWVIRRRLRETRELACDAKAIAAVQTPRVDYAQRLLSLSVSHREGLVLAPGFGTGILSRRFLKRRLTMVFDERVDGRISLGGIALALLLIAAGLPGFTLAQEAANTPAAGRSDTGSGATKSQSSASSATTETVTESSGDDVPRRTTVRARRLSRVLSNDEISGDKSATIELGNGGTIRISKTATGQLVVTVEQTEASDTPRFGRATGSSAAGTVDDGPDAETGAGSAGATGAGGSGRATDSIRLRNTLRRVSERGLRGTGTESDLDSELLRSDVELAEVNMMEKRAELEIAVKDNVDAGRRKLAELAVRRAEIELSRAKLRLSRVSSSSSGGSSGSRN